jgi:hypothetical protein
MSVRNFLSATSDVILVVHTSIDGGQSSSLQYFQGQQDILERQQEVAFQFGVQTVSKRAL